MSLTIFKDIPHTHYRIPSFWSLLTKFMKSFFNSRYILIGNIHTFCFISEYISKNSIFCCNVVIDRFYVPYDLRVLTCSSRLLFMSVAEISSLSDSLSVIYRWVSNYDFNSVFSLYSLTIYKKMQFSHS